MAVYGYNANSVRALDMAFRRDSQNTTDYFIGRRAHSAAIAGLQEKESEIKRKIAKAKSHPKPDMAQLARLECILSNIQGTLARYNSSLTR